MERSGHLSVSGVMAYERTSIAQKNALCDTLLSTPVLPLPYLDTVVDCNIDFASVFTYDRRSDSVSDPMFDSASDQASDSASDSTSARSSKNEIADKMKNM